MPITKSPEETASLASLVASKLTGGEVLALIGQLGAGKTTFTKSLIASLGVKEAVTSPTFVISQIYQVPNHPTIRQICHIDAYRLTESDVISTGIIEYFGRSDTVCIIEWPENLGKHFPANALRIKFEHIDPTTRSIEMREGLL